MNVLGSTLKKLEKDAVPAELLKAAEERPELPIKISEEIIALSEVISLKRIADALEDGLTTLTADNQVLGLADVAAHRA